MTRLVTSLLLNRPEEIAAAADRAFASGTDAVEIRLDGWADSSTSAGPACAGLPAGKWIVTCRPTSEGGRHRGTAAERASRLIEAARGGNGLVDFEFSAWRESEQLRKALRSAIADDGKGGQRIILSSHDFAKRPDDPRALLADMSAEGDLAAVKLAWSTDDVCDNLLAFDLLREAEVPTVVICMGAAGLMSRVLAAKFGAFATYCAPSPGSEAAPGQITIDDMLSHYRGRAINEHTRVFGVIGHPVAHSISPGVFNAYFERHGLDAVFLPLRVDPTPGVLERFLAGCCRRPWLDAGGFSVTIPHKESVAAFVGDRIDRLARRIGAVNTLVPSGGGAGAGFEGFNTDCAAALEAIASALDCDSKDLAGLRADVLGAGGVARAIIAGLRDCGAAVTVYNRSAERAAALAREFDCAFLPWDQRCERKQADLLVNCTSVGMWPDVGDTPLPAECLADEPAVFDTVYNPTETRLLREAGQSGCRVIDGLAMFVNQAAAQFELWTGQAADRTFMRTVADDLLAQQAASPSSAQGGPPRG